MSLAPGTTLGPYQITAKIGEGGMVVVYTAHDPRIDRPGGDQGPAARSDRDDPRYHEEAAPRRAGALRPHGLSQPVIGQTLSHYRILEKLGGGGMGRRHHDQRRPGWRARTGTRAHELLPESESTLFDLSGRLTVTVVWSDDESVSALKGFGAVFEKNH